MEQAINLIREFNEKFHTIDPGNPTTEINPEYRDLRINLMKEELEELILGMQNADLENIAKEIADLLYVIFGTISAYGLLDRFTEIFTEVHNSNMSKTYVAGKGKPSKLEGYHEANILKFLEG